jgi:hypothetical protein
MSVDGCVLWSVWAIIKAHALRLYIVYMGRNKKCVALGGLVVSVLATGPMVAGSKPAEDDGF